MKRGRSSEDGKTSGFTPQVVSGGASLAIERLDEFAILPGDHRALHFLRRGQLSTRLGELDGDNRESPDFLVWQQCGIHRVHDAGDTLHGLGVSGKLGVVGDGDPMSPGDVPCPVRNATGGGSGELRDWHLEV